MKHDFYHILHVCTFVLLLFDIGQASPFLDPCRLYFTVGVYIGYSGGAAVGVGPKFSIGYYTKNENCNMESYNAISNNITVGFMRHFGIMHPTRELILEIQTARTKYNSSRWLCLDATTALGAGASLVWYSIENDSLNCLNFYIRPRISGFFGNIFFLNVSKTFGLPRAESYNGLHIGGTALLYFPFSFFNWD